MSYPRVHHCHLFCGLPRTSRAHHWAAVALFRRNLGLLGPWALVGEGGNRPGCADWQGDYSCLREQRQGWPMGCEREEELGVHRNARGDGDLGLRRNWGAEEMERSRVLGKKGDRAQGYMGSTRLMKAPA